MKHFTMHTISVETAIDSIQQGKPIRDSHIIGDVDICKIERSLTAELVLSNCKIDNLVAPSFEFNYPVRLENCHFCKCSFNYAYFQRGLTIDNCIFDYYVDFEAGGHNQIGYCFQIRNSQFLEFVNFFDCWFMGEVVIENNDFRGGTNLLGNKLAPYRVQFDSTTRIENNRGALDVDGEGPKIINKIVL